MVRSDAELTPASAPWLADASARAVCAAIEVGGHQVLFVGGCVRNALIGAPASDVDLSTDARPERVIELAEAAGLTAVPTGIDHGTITVVAEGKGFEVTTYRKDVETDGRRAVVAFSDRIEDDAARRDFTMNALYATPQGRIVDPLGGLQDLRARRLRFIGDADARIREDYLRILRYFRFFAWYADQAEGFDSDALAAIGSNIGGLETLSAERIGAEMQRLLGAPDPVFALAGAQQSGVLGQILPGADIGLLGPLVHIEEALEVSGDWRVRLAALGGEDAPARFRLSRVDAKRLQLLSTVGYGADPLAEVAYRHGKEVATDALLLRGAIAQKIPDMVELETINHAAKCVFPVKAADLQPAYEGPALGQRLGKLEQVWIDSGFSMTKADLLAPP